MVAGLQPASTPFGCRLVATMGLDSTTMLDTLGASDKAPPRNFRDQGTPGQGHPFETGMNGIFSELIWSPKSRKGSHDNSYGLIETGVPDAEVQKRTGSSKTDADYPDIVKKLAGKNVLGHLRFATIGAADGEAALRNAQPFAAEGLSLIHNGTMRGAKTDPGITQAIQTYLPEEQLYEDDSDSRRTFLYVRAKLRETYGTSNAHKLTSDQIAPVVVTALKDVIDRSPSYYEKLSGDRDGWGINGVFRYHGSNFIVGFNNTQLAYRHNVDLFLWARLNDKNQLVSTLIKTEPPHQKGWQWRAILNDGVLRLDHQPDGTISGSMYPVEQFNRAPQARSHQPTHPSAHILQWPVDPEFQTQAAKAPAAPGAAGPIPSTGRQTESHRSSPKQALQADKVPERSGTTWLAASLAVILGTTLLLGAKALWQALESLVSGKAPSALPQAQQSTVSHLA